jgi:hypothetical protein
MKVSPVLVQGLKPLQRKRMRQIYGDLVKLAVLQKVVVAQAKMI